MEYRRTYSSSETIIDWVWKIGDTDDLKIFSEAPAK